MPLVRILIPVASPSEDVIRVAEAPSPIIDETVAIEDGVALTV